MDIPLLKPYINLFVFLSKIYLMENLALCPYQLSELTFIYSVTMAGMESIAVFHLWHLLFESGLNGSGQLRLTFPIIHIWQEKLSTSMLWWKKRGPLYMFMIYPQISTAYFLRSGLASVGIMWLILKENVLFSHFIVVGTSL